MNKEMRKVIFETVLFFLLSSCAAFQSVHYGQEYSEPTAVSKIQVFSSQPALSYVKLGEVSVFGVTKSNRSYMIGQLKKMAAEMGGDAIILQERELPRYVPKPIKGIVIKWKLKKPNE